MGEVDLFAFDSETGRPTASISGSPVDFSRPGAGPGEDDE